MRADYERARAVKRAQTRDRVQQLEKDAKALNEKAAKDKSLDEEGRGLKRKEADDLMNQAKKARTDAAAAEEVERIKTAKQGWHHTARLACIEMGLTEAYHENAVYLMNNFGGEIGSEPPFSMKYNKVVSDKDIPFDEKKPLKFVYSASAHQNETSARICFKM